MVDGVSADLAAIGKIEAIPTILEVVCRTTGMGFAAVARVTEDRWIACSVKDDIAFGLEPGGELQVATTICHEIRQSGQPVVINNVAQDGAWCSHPTPALYGFQSYISMPITLRDGRFFGTLCAIDPRPNQLDSPEVIGMFRLFADLIAFHLHALEEIETTGAGLLAEQRTSELREQFIAVLGHDLRNPLTAITTGAELLSKMSLNAKASRMVEVIRGGAARMSNLIDDVMDFARGRLGSGVALDRHVGVRLEPVLRHVIAELQTSFPARRIDATIALDRLIPCDPIRDRPVAVQPLGERIDLRRGRQPNPGQGRHRSATLS